MAEVLVRVCDVCMSPGDTVRHYSITVDDDTITMDLCDQHAGPIAPSQWSRTQPAPVPSPFEPPAPPAKKAAKKAPAKRTGRPRQRTMTLEEIEELKKAQ